MSVKSAIPLQNVGMMDTDTNPLRLPPGTSRLLQNCGDLDNEGKISLQKGYDFLYSQPVMANCTDGTVTVSNGSNTVTGSSTTWLSNATHSDRVTPGDIFVGPDSTRYVVKSVESDTSLTLETAYAGTSAAAQSYTVVHKVWLLKQYYTDLGGADSVTDVTLSGGTTTNTEEIDGIGIALEPDVNITNGTLVRTLQTQYPRYNSTKVGVNFTPTANSTIASVYVYSLSNDWFGIFDTQDYTTDVDVRVETDSSGNPSGTLADPNSKGTLAYDAAEGINRIDFDGSFTLTSGTKYWFVLSRAASGFGSDKAVFGSVNTKDNTKRYVESFGGWSEMDPSDNSPWFQFLEYPTSGENTWVSDTVDAGFIPNASGIASLTRAYSYSPITPYNSLDTTDSLKYDLEYSDDGSAWTYAGTGDGTYANANFTSLTTVIDNSATFGSGYHRYWRVTLYMRSANSYSTPLVSDVNLTFIKREKDIGTSQREGRFYLVTGAGDTLFKNAKPSSTDTLQVGVEHHGWVDGVQYQRKFFYTTGNQVVKYWNGTDAVANVSALTQADGTAGDDPPERADRLIFHNDRLLLYRNVERVQESGTSTGLTNVVLTDTGQTWKKPDGVADWADNDFTGWRLYPNVDGAVTGTAYPKEWYPITSNDIATDTISCSSSTINTYAAAGDGYEVARNYTKAAWYSTLEEPSDWGTLSLFLFGDQDGDTLQACVSWKRRLIAITENSVWRVIGYDTSDFEKSQIDNTVGTLSPYSVVDAGEMLLWWAPEGIVAYMGGYSRPQIISGTLKSIVKDGINTSLMHHVTGAYFEGLCFWSYPSSGSNINNKTMIYNPSTGRILIRDFGMYSPLERIKDDGNTELIFFEPTSGLIARYGQGYLQGGDPQDLELKMAHVVGGTPNTDTSWYDLLVVLESDATASINVEYATDYGTSYTSAGTLEPIDADVTGRSGVSSSDTVYKCTIPNGGEEVLSPSISIKLTGPVRDRFEILNINLIGDPVDAKRYYEIT